MIGEKQIAAIVVIILIIFFCRFIDNHKPGQKIKWDKVKRGKKGEARGVIFGKVNKNTLAYSPVNAEGHILINGGSGLGKTSALLIPTLRSWTGTSFSIDISGDICKNVPKKNKMIYEPGNAKSIPYNIFGAVDEEKNLIEKNELLEQLAFLMMPDKEDENGAGEFFNTEGRKILTSALICFYAVGMDFIPICEKIIGSSWKDLLNEIADYDNAKANQYISSFAGANSENNAGCKQSMDKCIKLFATNEKVKRTIRRPKKGERCFTPRAIEKHNVFVLVEDSKLKLYAPLLNIITAQSLEYFSERSNNSKNTILFCLDEFASLGEMEILDALRKLRKKHVRIMVLTQSMADMDLIYGKVKRIAMMNNFPFKVVLGADDSDTQEYFAKLVGQKDSVRRSVSKSIKNSTQTEAEQKEWAIPPADFARLENYLVLLSPDGFVKLKKNFYFQN